MPIFHGISTKNKAEIIHDAIKMQRVYVGDKLVWQKNTIHVGLFYNRPVVDDARGIAPVDWRISNIDDVMSLLDFYGGEALAGGDLKALEGWNLPNVGATEASLFKALPAGQRNELGAFSGILEKTIFWIK